MSARIANTRNAIILKINISNYYLVSELRTAIWIGPKEMTYASSNTHDTGKNAPHHICRNKGAGTPFSDCLKVRRRLGC